MKQMDDYWMRPRTKAGTEEMRKRLKVMRGMLEEAANHDFSTLEPHIASKVFNEYFSPWYLLINLLAVIICFVRNVQL